MYTSLGVNCFFLSWCDWLLVSSSDCTWHIRSVIQFHNSWSPVLKVKSCLRHALTCRGVYYSFYAIWLAVTCIISFISNWKASGHLSQDVLSAWSCPEDSGLLFFSWFLRNRVDALAKSCYYSCSGFYSLSHKASRSHLYRSYKIEEHSNTIQTLRLLWSYLSLPDKKRCRLSLSV